MKLKYMQWARYLIPILWVVGIVFDIENNNAYLLGAWLVVSIFIVSRYLETHNFGWLVVGAGAFLNKVVMIANGLRMPVLTLTEPRGRWIPLTPDTRFNFLADIHFDIITGGMASKGDYVILVGSLLAIGVWAYRRYRKHARGAFENAQATTIP